ncbi:MAG: nucleoside hydrolase [Micavibrio sp.]
MNAPSSSPLIIDCDTGRDDALAIWAVLGLGQNLAGVVASYGNVPLSPVIDNSARVLTLMGRDDIPLFAGAAAPSTPHKFYEQVVLPRQEKSGNGLCNLEYPKAGRILPTPPSPEDLPENLAENLVRIAREKGPLDYIILGPATNFAALCGVLGDSVTRYISSVTMMGGKLGDLWDATPAADFNFVCDPFAVRDVLGCGLAPRFVTLNTTWPICLNEHDVESLAGTEKIAGAARDLMLAHIRSFAPEPVFRFHDPAVIIAATNPARFQPVKLDILCDDQSADFGRLVLKENGFPAALYQSDAEHGQNILRLILGALRLKSY